MSFLVTSDTQTRRRVGRSLVHASRSCKQHKKKEKRTQQSQVDDTGRVTASLVQLEWLNTSNLVTSTKRIQKDTLLWSLTFTLRKNNENLQKDRRTTTLFQNVQPIVPVMSVASIAMFVNGSNQALASDILHLADKWRKIGGWKVVHSNYRCILSLPVVPVAGELVLPFLLVHPLRVRASLTHGWRRRTIQYGVCDEQQPYLYIIGILGNIMEFCRCKNGWNPITSIFSI
jgi:hypothetical protein